MKTLKYSYFALVFGILTFFSSCGSDDDSSPANLSLEGRIWTQISESITNCTDETKNRSASFVCTAMECYTFFAEDGIFTFRDTEAGILETRTGAYTISGNEITIVDTSTSTVTVTGSGTGSGTATITTTTAYTIVIVGDTLTLSFADADVLSFLDLDGCLLKAVYKAL